VGSWKKLMNPFGTILQDRVAVGKKDSSNRKIQKFPEALAEKGGVRAVFVRQGHQAMRGQMDQGIAHHQSAGQGMKKGSFCLTGAGQRESRKSRNRSGDLPIGSCCQFCAGPIVISVGADNADRRSGERSLLGPVDGIKESGSLWGGKAGRPELGFAGGIVSVPSGETVAVRGERTRGEAQGAISSGWQRTGWRKGDDR